MLKLDMEFLRGIDKNGRGKTIVKHMVEMAKELVIPVIAEGVQKFHKMYIQIIPVKIDSGNIDHEMMQNMLKEQEVKNDMWDALKNDQFKVYVQPKYDVISGQNVHTDYPCKNRFWKHLRKLAEPGFPSPCNFADTGDSRDCRGGGDTGTCGALEGNRL